MIDDPESRSFGMLRSFSTIVMPKRPAYKCRSLILSVRGLILFSDMRIRTKMLFLVLPLLATPLFLSGLVSALEARNGITRVAVDFLRFKAEELRKYAAQQWGILEENALCG